VYFAQSLEGFDDEELEYSDVKPFFSKKYE
jgi:hypothetical protein